MNKSEHSSTIIFITWTRAISTILILLCHLVQSHSNAYIIMTAQLFNIGVNIFFLLSGFLYGIKGIPKPLHVWWFKRFQRIIVPYWIFLAILAFIHMMMSYSDPWTDWVYSIFCMQEFLHLLTGAEQTWFLTPLLLCYLLLPFIAYSLEYLEKRWRSAGIVLILILICSAIFIMVAGYHVPMFIAPLCSSVAYIIGHSFYKITITPKRFAGSIGLMGCMFLIRLCAKFIIDETPLYNNIIVNITQYIAAFCCIIACSFLFDSIQIRPINFINQYSYEVYLCHYMIMYRPFSVMTITSSWILNAVLCLCLSFIAAIILSKITKWIINHIKWPIVLP